MFLQALNQLGRLFFAFADGAGPDQRLVALHGAFLPAQTDVRLAEEWLRSNPDRYAVVNRP